ncbi:MAG TPA: ATP-binding cassette domain-containing protein [Tenuifilaceae bacterium]|nr:ATP-binding cassette domain-containing protein [Tenuifilaceae bacterium]HPX07685.1 ATP-binding cassette domain-containing protein [Tenuifilaceae bacterium]HQC65791.1 ATP-binding cassette domain-containing protein [Tenuifilaceae bacterium]
MISIENLCISYGKDKRVIENLQLTISEGTINGIVGLNGAGKTTLLNAMYGVKGIDTGGITWHGERLSKKIVSYLVAEPFFYSNITGYEHLSLFENSHFPTEKWNELFHLPLHRIVDEYSSGMKKKLAILSVIKQDKPLIILDEPFNGLDMETCRILHSILLKIKQMGKTVIITSHIIETLTNLCDFIHYLEGGKIRFSKDKSEFKEFERELIEGIENRNEYLMSELLGKSEKSL